MFISLLNLVTSIVTPQAVYDGGFNNASPILLRIGNGGAGQSGLVKGELLYL